MFYKQREYERIRNRLNYITKWVKLLPKELNESQTEMYRAYEEEFHALKRHINIILKYHTNTPKLRVVK